MDRRRFLSSTSVLVRQAEYEAHEGRVLAEARAAARYRAEELFKRFDAKALATLRTGPPGEIAAVLFDDAVFAAGLIRDQVLAQGGDEELADRLAEEHRHEQCKAMGEKLSLYTKNAKRICYQKRAECEAPQ
jgi:hypothetical protein